jgi:hypothetical protein
MTQWANRDISHRRKAAGLFADHHEQPCTMRGAAVPSEAAWSMFDIGYYPPNTPPTL